VVVQQEETPGPDPSDAEHGAEPARGDGQVQWLSSATHAVVPKFEMENNEQRTSNTQRRSEGILPLRCSMFDVGCSAFNVLSDGSRAPG
jgi:hypothetical protein